MAHHALDRQSGFIKGFAQPLGLGGGGRAQAVERGDLLLLHAVEGFRQIAQPLARRGRIDIFGNVFAGRVKRLGAAQIEPFRRRFGILPRQSGFGGDGRRESGRRGSCRRRSRHRRSGRAADGNAGSIGRIDLGGQRRDQSRARFQPRLTHRQFGHFAFE